MPHTIRCVDETRNGSVAGERGTKGARVAVAVGPRERGARTVPRCRSSSQICLRLRVRVCACARVRVCAG